MVSLSKMSGRRNGSARRPHFFKVLLGDFKQRLKIPPRFMKHMRKRSSQIAILQGPNGSSWQVELRETLTGNFLSAGWSNFVEDHSLREHEFLVFRYNGNMHFNVMIFDTTACEREDVFEIKTPKRSSSEGKKIRGRPAKRSLDVNLNLQHQSSKNDLPMLPSYNKHKSEKSYGQQLASSKPTSDVIIITKDLDPPIHKTHRKSFYLSRRRPVTTKEKSIAEKAARSFRSPFPYTIIQMKAPFVYKSFIMRFPTDFSPMHLPRKKTCIVLRDPSGKVWRVVYIPGCDRGNGYLSGGWWAFAHGNFLEEDDFCAFELIAELELRVHIFRVVEETTPLAKITVGSP